MKVYQYSMKFLFLAALLILFQPFGFAKKNNNDEVVVVTEEVKVFPQALSTLSDVRDARFAIFDGQTDVSKKLLEKSHKAFEQDIEKYAVYVHSLDAFAVPVDATVTFAEGFKPSDKQSAVIKKSGELMQKGKKKEAIKAMKDAGVDLNYRYAMLPITSTLEHLNKAIRDIRDEKYYEANLTLKAISASVDIIDLNVEDLPKQGYRKSKIKKGK